MGIISQNLGDISGRLIARNAFNGSFKHYENQSGAIGSVLGNSLIPKYLHGGRVNIKGKRKGQAIKAIIHQDEYIIPVGLKVPNSVRKEVKKRNKKFK